MNISIVVTQEEHYKYAQEICDTIESSALLRGTGIAKRTPEYIQKKMEKGDAVIALNNGIFAGFCYIESWQHGQFVRSLIITNPTHLYISTYFGRVVKLRDDTTKINLRDEPHIHLFSLVVVVHTNYILP